MSELPADAVPERTLLETNGDYLEGFNRLLGLVRRELRIFDPDLSEIDMNSTRRIETLTRFLRQDRARVIHVGSVVRLTPCAARSAFSSSTTRANSA